MPNMDIRIYLKERRVPLWRLADALSIHENTLLRRLRHELPEAEKARLRAIVDDISGGNVREG